MAQSSKDIQLLELKDTIAQLNNLISGLQKTIDNLNLQLANKDAELNYLKSKLLVHPVKDSRRLFRGS